MVSGHHKSRTFRRVYVKTPGNRTVIHYRKRKPAKAKCAGCKKELSGTTRARSKELKRVAKTKCRPQRPFGGQYCSACARRTLIAKARQ
ncbi:MAG: 50S ribosomal protein L34e [Nanoarchaeota archaeon]